MEVTGKIISFGDVSNGTSKAGKNWTKQTFVIETVDQYPKKIAIEVMNAKVDDLSFYGIGNEITASINIESREYNGRWYTSVSAWKLAGSPSNSSPRSKPADNQEDSTSDDLPF